ncbi:MAG: hypothetical protein ACI9MC_002758, partial [Kiritimatiellia bacterium]
AAEELAAKHAPDEIARLNGCSSPVDTTACTTSAKSWVQRFGLRAFRRPLTSEERARYEDLFVIGTTLGEDASYDPTSGVELVLSGMLQSPAFLYRVEFGQPDPVQGDVVPLTSYEMASRLSYFFWGTMPDDALLEAAAADELQDPVQIERHARRLLDAQRSRPAIRHFHRQWLHLDEVVTKVRSAGKDYEVYPDYRPFKLPLLQEETEAFLEAVIFEGEGTVEEMYTASWSMRNEELSDWYGDTPPSGASFTRVDRDPSIHSGFLSHAGLMMLYAKPDRTSPVKRGHWVRERLLCDPPPSPPDVVPDPPTVDETQTTRDQFEQHQVDPNCAGCHKLMDPIGFGFENFDGLGKFRETQNGQQIDASGYFYRTNDLDGDFYGVVDLGQKLGNSQQVRDCVAKQWFRYAHGRALSEDDSCSMDSALDRFEQGEFSVRELLVALALTDAFRYRHAVGGQ